jgi:hypothetical protein
VPFSWETAFEQSISGLTCRIVQTVHRFELAGASRGQSMEVSAIQIGVLLDGRLSAMADFRRVLQEGPLAARSGWMHFSEKRLFHYWSLSTSDSASWWLKLLSRQES